MLLPLIPQDKANHAIYGAVVALAAYSVGLAGHIPHAPVIGLAAATTVGALKELADWLLNRRAIAAGLPPPHGVEFLDFAATSLGGCAVWLAANLAAML
jgi:hypothetical protein